MILTQACGESKKFNSKIARKLWDCTLIKTYTECGWFYAAGYNFYKSFGKQKRVLVVRSHMKSEDEFLRKMRMQCQDCSATRGATLDLSHFPEDMQREKYTSIKDRLCGDGECKRLANKRQHML